jgi:hypothetical protein
MFLVLLSVFASAAYLVFCGTESALLASTIVMSSSHNITASLYYCSVDYFIPIIAILKYDFKRALNIVVRNLFMVGNSKP